MKAAKEGLADIMDNMSSGGYGDMETQQNKRFCYTRDGVEVSLLSNRQ